MRYQYTLGCLIFLILVSGCTSIRDQGLVVALQADPPTVFSRSTTLLHIDIDNRNQKSMTNVQVDLFDTGLLSTPGNFGPEKCSKYFGRLLPYEFQSITCLLYAPQTNATVQTQVNALVNFDSKLEATQIFEVVSEQEYQNRVTSGHYDTRPSNYIYGDKNVMIKVDFNEPLPLVIRPDKKYFVYFTVTNVGDGFIQFIQPDDLVLWPVRGDLPVIVKCPERQALAPVGKQFPRIACELDLPPGFAASGFFNADFIISLNYRYEIRSSLDISIIK